MTKLVDRLLHRNEHEGPAPTEGLRQMCDTCERLVAQSTPLGPDESAYDHPQYTNGQVYAMMAGTQSAENFLGPDLSPADAEGLAARFKAFGVEATSERAEYFWIGAVAYLMKHYRL